MSEGMLGEVPLSAAQRLVGELLENLAGQRGFLWLQALEGLLHQGFPAPGLMSADPLKVWRTPWPPVDAVFELTYDGGASENQPSAMAEEFGLRHSGPNISGCERRWFKIVELFGSGAFEGVRADCARRGKIPEGHWLKAMRNKFIAPPGRPVGIADASWSSPEDGRPRFPFLDEKGVLGFTWSEFEFPDHWLWVVEVA